MIPFPLLMLGFAALRGRSAPSSRAPASSAKPSRAPASSAADGAPLVRSDALEPAQAARGLADYLRGGGNFGAKGRTSTDVKRLQRSMGMTVKESDGIVGPRTRAVSRALGVTLPLRGRS